MHVHMHAYVHVHVHLHANMHIVMLVYIYVHMHLLIRIHTYICKPLNIEHFGFQSLTVASQLLDNFKAAHIILNPKP